MTESPTAVTCPATNPAAGAGWAVILGVVVVVVVDAVVAVTVVVFGSAMAGVVAVVVAVVAFGSAMAVVVVQSATVVRLVECTGGGLGAPARRAGAAAQPAAMIPITPTTSSARGRPLRPAVCVTGSLLPRPPARRRRA